MRNIDKPVHFLIGILFLGMTSLPEMVISETESYLVRVRVHVDKAGMDEFTFENPGKNLTDHVTNMFENVNEAYKSLLPTLNITLELEQLIVLDKNLFKTIMTWKDHLAIFSSASFFDYLEWRAKTHSPTEYDIGILLTGFELYDVFTGSSGVYGYTHIGKVCSASSAAVVEIQEPYGTLGLGHEIGHLLGARHDPDGPKDLCGPGTYEDGNFMSLHTNLDSPLRFTFSKCSALQISENLAKLTRDLPYCLSGGTNISALALEITADELCERTEGKGWTMLRLDQYGDRFCDRFFCNNAVKGGSSTYPITPPDGLKCGKSKRCFQRQCVHFKNGDSNMTDDCPWGSQDDSYIIRRYGKPCGELDCAYDPAMCCGHCPR